MKPNYKAKWERAVWRIVYLQDKVEKLLRERRKLLGPNGASWRKTLAGTRFKSKRLPRRIPVA
jgi:hypothetical protein